MRHVAASLLVALILAGTAFAQASPELSGAASGPDKGAGEANGVNPCPWDCGDGNGFVDAADILQLLAEWGQDGPCNFDGGVIGTSDLLELLSNWGPCFGACCLPDGTCADGTPVDCEAAAGVFQGPGTSCDTTTCPDLLGACCLPDGTCAEILELACDVAGGFFHGTAIDCADVQCSFPECPGGGGCFGGNGTPGCSDQSCCNLVCSADPFCCNTEWDQACAGGAAQLCANCGDPDAGSCYEANGSVGCNDLICCAEVCEQDPFCCTNEWDSLCADGAINACNVRDCDDPVQCQGPDLVTAFPSNVDLQVVQAEAFVVNAADPVAVSALCWRGAYFNFFTGNCGPGPDAFTVSYYLDSGAGVPGDLLASFDQIAGTLAVADPDATGNLISDDAIEYEHTAAHAPLMLDPGTCYWIEISNSGPDPSECAWLWESSSDGNGASAEFDGVSWTIKPFDHAFCLDVPLYGDAPCPCPLEVPAGAILEDEPCGEATNNGCNQDPPAFTPAACGDVFYGTAWAEDNLRDTDFYMVDHPGGVLQATLTSQFPGVCAIFDGLDTCDPLFVGQFSCSDGCESFGVASASLPAGTYTVFVAPAVCSGDGVFDGIPCGGVNSYVLEIECLPTGRCCLPAGQCDILTEAQCATQGGAYGGDGTSCFNFGEGACCLPDGSCIVTTQGLCVISGGTFQSVCFSCGEDVCCVQEVGACILPDGTCIETLPIFCIGQGVYQGDCTTCP